MTNLGTGDVGWRALADWHNPAVKYGSNAPWYITEVGQCIGGTSCSAPVYQAQQATDMTQYLNDLVQRDPNVPGTPYTFVKYFAWYESWDNTGDFGLFNYSGGPGSASTTITGERPALQALAAWMSAHVSQTNG